MSSSFAGAALQATLALVAVSALAALVLRLVRHRFVSPGPALRVVSRLGLEPRRTLYLVEAGGKFLLVGVGDGPMTVLAELPRDEVAKAEAAAAPVESEAALLKSMRSFLGGKAS